MNINHITRVYEALITEIINNYISDKFIYFFLAYHQNRMNNIKIILIVAPCITSNYLISIQTDAHI